MSATEELTAVADTAEVAIGAQLALVVKGRRLLICRTSEGLFAMLDLCPHARQPLAGGALTGASIVCPHHGACFNLHTGRPLNGVTAQSLTLLPVHEEDGRIWVKPPPAIGGYLAFQKN